MVRWMATHNVTLIPGDGIGPEVSEATRRVLDATGVRFAWDVCEAGEGAAEKFGEVLPEETLASIRKNKTGLKGPITTPIGGGFRSVNVGLRHSLGLFANLRPGKTITGVQSTFKDIDLVVVRENMEDHYAGVEFDTGAPDTAQLVEVINELSKKPIAAESAITIKTITPEGSRRIAKFAFDYARANSRKKVTIVHKANIMKFTDGLFLKVAQQVDAKYPDIESNDRIVDNMCMHPPQKPDEDVLLVMPNLYGDIISDPAAGMVGDIGVAPRG